MITTQLKQYIMTSPVCPEQIRQEWYERLNDLCGLTGTPMSPLLTSWVKSYFNLEMVRVIENFSNLSTPVLTPALKQLCAKAFPTNFNSNNIRYEFIDLFSSPCGPSLCHYEASIAVPTGGLNQLLCSFETPAGSFADQAWLVIPRVQTAYPSFGAYDDQISTIYMTIVSDGTDLTGWTFTDFDSNVYPITWNEVDCPNVEKCAETDPIDLSSATTGRLTQILGVRWQGADSADVVIDITAAQAALIQLLQNSFGSQASATIVNNGGFYTITVSGIPTEYITAAPSLFIEIDGGGPFEFALNEIVCP